MVDSIIWFFRTTVKSVGIFGRERVKHPYNYVVMHSLKLIMKVIEFNSYIMS